MVRLRELEREAQANRELFQTFLSRVPRKRPRRSICSCRTRSVVSARHVPIAPSFPRRLLIVALGAFVAFGFGIVLSALARDTFSTGFRSAEHIEMTFGLAPLGSVPLVESPRRWRSHVAPLLGDLRGLHRGRSFQGPPTATARPRRPGSRRLAGLALDQPNSAFAESIRSLKFALKHAATGARYVVVLVTSALPGEGKSTVAANLARVAARTTIACC